MRRLAVAAMVLVMAGAGAAVAGVVPSSGAQSMSGAKIKAPTAEPGTEQSDKTGAPGDGDQH